MGVGILAAVSTVIAFRGWPGITESGVTTPRAMLAGDDRVPALERVASRASIVVPDTRRSAGRERSARSAPAAPATPGTTGTIRVVKPPTDTVDPPVVHKDPSAPRQPQPPARTPSATAPVRQAGTDLGAASDTAAEGLGKALEPVSPTLGQTVKDAGTVVGDTVEGVTNTVSDLLDPLLNTKP
jgi:hypothetical protein